MHRTILPFLPIFLFVVLCVSVLAPHRVEAIVAVVPLAAVSLVEVFMAVLLFVLIPASLAGIIIRLLGGRRDGVGQWRITFGALVGVFLKYLSYHALLLAGSLAIFGFSRSTPGHDFFAVDTGVSVALIVYLAALAVFAPYVVYGVRRLRDARARAPSAGLHLRLFVWNIVCVLALQYLFVWVEPYLMQGTL
ncbi:hypothetical protein HY416_02110 [Candidatus Kaiserbacteria bacterium]|nr:hypothetical protein [Candidatus Kaiserbacteria bacterium]